MTCRLSSARLVLGNGSEFARTLPIDRFPIALGGLHLNHPTEPSRPSFPLDTRPPRCIIPYASFMHAQVAIMARTTISISDDLKKRMDRIKEPVNWSAVAADAFEYKLREIVRNQEGKTMDVVIERLRASRARSGMDYFALGQARGIEWAKQTAEFGELRRLERFDFVDMLEHHSAKPDGASSWSEKIAFDILPGPNAHTPAEALEFWKSSAGVLDKEHLKSVKFLHGFVTGAVSIYEQVKEAL